jgi:hypothetical protein
VYCGSTAACQAKYISTAYSGKTQMSAKMATASDCEISICATSAAQERMNAAPRIAQPKITASIGGATC